MRPSLVAPTLNRQQPPAPPSALKKFAPSRCAPDKFALLKVVPRRSAIVSFLNLQPALSLVGGNRSSCPRTDLAQMERARKGGGHGAHGAEHHSFTGVRMGAPLPFSSTTTNLA